MKISLISTVKDAGPHIGEFLESVRAQTRAPDEVIICDGGSVDGTLETLRESGDVKVIVEDGANIPRGRILAIREASGDVIAVSDADCVLDPRWLEELARVIDSGADVAMGFYRPITDSFFEVCSAATHLPDPHEVDPATFMPSSRSVAFRREAYEEAGGYPEWLEVGEDMYLDHRLRENGADMRMAIDAVAHWRVRPTIEQTWTQYFRYAKGDAMAGMYPERHVVRFCTYGGAALLSRWRLGRLLLLVGGIAYAARPIGRAFRMLSDRSPAEKAGAVVAVPGLMLLTDLAKMAGYLSGQLRRGWANE
jgi:glycosyltransferase involved in cell wall biosynthesis